MAKWSIPIDKWAQAAKGDLNKAARMVALEVNNSLLIKSPVDTGRFRGNWQMGLNAVPNGSFADVRAAAPDAAGKIGAFKLGDTIHFTNNLPYAVRLEYGYSKQAPKGIVRLTVKEFKGMVKRAAR